MVAEPAKRLSQIQLFTDERGFIFAMCLQCVADQSRAVCLVGNSCVGSLRCPCGYPFFRSVEQYERFVLLAKVVGRSLPALQAFFDDEDLR